MRKTKTVAAAVAAMATGIGMGGIISPALQSNAAPTSEVRLSNYVGTGSDASAGIRAAVLALQTKNNWQGGKIIVDGQWTVNTTIKLDELANNDPSKRYWNMVTMEGTGIGSSKLTRGVTGPMFSMQNSAKPVTIYNLRYINMGFEATPDATSYIWENTAGAITNSVWEKVAVEIKGQGGVMNNATTAASPNGAEFHSNTFRDCMFYVSKDSRYIPMRFESAKHFVNGNNFDRMWLHHRLNSLKPFILMKPKSGQYTNNSFRAITGEQNLGGLIHLYGQNGGKLDAVFEWDGAAPGYQNHVIVVENSYGVVIAGSGQVVKNYYAAKPGTKTIQLANNQYVVTSGSAVGYIPVNG